MSAATATANYAAQRVERNAFAFKRAKNNAFALTDMIRPLFTPKTESWPFCTPCYFQQKKPAKSQCLTGLFS